MRKAAAPKATPAKRSLNIPPILLEGDRTPAPKVAGPGTRYALAPVPSAAQVTAVLSPGELPAAYGTRRLFLTARDPRWLYASWDLSAEQQNYFNQVSRDGHLMLRVFANDEQGPALPEVHVNPESRTWFINVPRPETRYRAELGYYSSVGAWQTVTSSSATFTPPDAPADQPAVAQFATIPAQVTFQQVVEQVQEFVSEHKPLLEAVIIAQEAQRTEIAPQAPPAGAAAEPKLAPVERPDSRAAVPNILSPVEPPRKRAKKQPASEISIRVEQRKPWPPERVAALAALIHIDSYRRVWMGSIEITELVRRQLQVHQGMAEEMASIAAAELSRQAAAMPGERGFEFGISSPAELARPRERKFWFKVNAELVLYGATEPDAQVSIADRPVRLRPDGTFSFRFALPDGRYELPAIARSADGVEAREANLEFSRSTEYRGHVEVHPQDPGLRAPRAENI